jgi:VCBS repeat-containing protein
VQWTLQPVAGAGTPTGTVTVTAGAGVTPCSAPASFGTASCDLMLPTAGDKTITASYSGDANFFGDSDSKTHKVNAPPTAADDNFSMLEDEVLTVSPGNGVLKNDNDPDNGPQTRTARNFSNPAHGTLTAAADGSFTYTPDPDYNGTDRFTYEVFDGAAAAPATVTITIGSVNDSPSFTPGQDTVTVNAAGGAYSQPWASDVTPGPANESDQTLSFVVSVDPFGQALFDVDGQPSIAPDGTLSFSPSGFIGVATVTVRLQDNGGTQDGGVDSTAEHTFKIVIN